MKLFYTKKFICRRYECNKGFNLPYLLCLLCRHGSKEDSIFPSLPKDYQTKHVHSIVTDVQVYGDLKQFCHKELESLYDWQLPQFIQSWASQEHILYYQKCDDGKHFSVLVTLPCLTMLLSEITSKLSDGTYLHSKCAISTWLYL